jgi:hypothetical protein
MPDRYQRLERMPAAGYRPELVSEQPGRFLEPSRARKFRFSAALSMPVQVQASVRLGGSNGSSKVVLDGVVVLAGLGATLSYGRGAHRDLLEDHRYNQQTMLIPTGEWFVVATSAAPAPMASGAPLGIRFHDGDGSHLSEKYNLGSCGSDPRDFSLSFYVPVVVKVEITTDDSSLGPDSHSTIGGTLMFPRGILARCAFPSSVERNGNGAPVRSTDAVAIPVGQTIRFPEQLIPRSGPARALHELSFQDGHGQRLGSVCSREAAD